MDRTYFHDSNVHVDLPTWLSPSEKDTCLSFVDQALSSPDTEIGRKWMLANIPMTVEPSAAPISILSTLLAYFPGPWPVFDVQCSYARVWKHLPEHVKAGESNTDMELTSNVQKQVMSVYSNLLDLLPRSSKPAIRDVQSESALNHDAIVDFIGHFRLPVDSASPLKTRVALVLPNGAQLALAILATTTYYTACPLSTMSGPEQFRSDLAQSEASIVLVTRADVKRLGLNEQWVRDAGISVLVLEQKPDSTFTMRYDDGTIFPPLGDETARPCPNSPLDTALMLFTSGTSGTKKTVPITVHSLVAGVAFVIESWGLRADDVCLNMMPLFHVGGIVRNLFAPVMAGGSTICCAAFDANMFWDIMEDHGPTWYYASPTMHQMILEASQYRQDALRKSKMRLICNAAGGLLPSLACNLRDTFGCTVLPSYGMTECMPISSPPLNYQLDRPGTSGISVGPDLAILDVDDNAVVSGEIGEIAVRGAPLFEGYLKKDGTIDRSPFTAGNWFRTGDMGYLDDDGFLFVTGRSKEVINRGGELISPFEVEEAVLSASQRAGSPIEGRVSGVLAFSMPHLVLQEVVGLVIVTSPGARKVCIRTVQEAVKESLSQVKWPQVIVFMDDLPKNNNKLLRIKLGQRMDMEDLTDDVLLSDRHYNAVCPPPNSPLTEKIIQTSRLSDLDKVAHEVCKVTGSDHDVYVRQSATNGYPEVVFASCQESSSTFQSLNLNDLRRMLKAQLDDLDMPDALHKLEAELPVMANGEVDHKEVDRMIKAKVVPSTNNSALTNTETKIATLFSQVLACPLSQLSPVSDFFDMGGDSLKAGKLLSELRRETKTRIPIDLLFNCGQISALADYVEKTTEVTTRRHSVIIRKIDLQPVMTKVCSSTNPFLLAVQLLPIIAVYPMKRALTWTIFMYVLAASQFWPTAAYLVGRVFNLMISLAAGRLVTFLVAPLFAISCKWLIIGRYREGIYPMWGFYHTRWWLVQKIVSICGKGHFGLSNGGLVLYYRLLGAKVGSNVTIAKSATLGEYDLLEIGNGATLDKCIFRGFAIDKNTSMYLGKTKIGSHASIGINSVVAPGTTVPDTTCIGPNSSSWELDAADEGFRCLSASKVPVANFILDVVVSYPLSTFVNLVRSSPWIGGLVPLVLNQPDPEQDFVLGTILWFAQPYRIGLHYLALILHSYLGPIAWFIAILLVKKLFDTMLGKQVASAAAGRSQMERLRQSVLKHIIPLPRLHKVIELFGAHYEITSMIYRALGARVGQRVYWPGTGPVVQDFDLLDIGDDVVFGSRSQLLTSDGRGSDPIRIGDGAMIADRVTLLPGTTVGEKTVFGSGALSRRDKAYQPGTVWVGSKGGEAICLSDTRKQAAVAEFTAGLDKRLTTIVAKDFGSHDLESAPITPVSATPYSTASGIPVTPSPPSGIAQSTTPFGRAFYDRLAPYHVYGLTAIVFYSSFLTIFTTFYWNVGTTTALQTVAVVLPHFTKWVSPASAARPFLIFALFAAFISVLQTCLAVLALGIVIAAKWILLGRRTPGNYNWDKSPYCQRWQLFLTIERLRRQCYGGQGILGLLTGTHYMVLYFRALGARIGEDCALFASGDPSCLFTEPDLLTLGDRVGVDDASLVGHINSRGVFDLNELHVGDGSVLRSGSRLLSGARMGKGAVLMEHTLVMAGDEVEDGTVRQGWPSEEWEGERMPTLSKAQEPGVGGEQKQQ